MWHSTLPLPGRALWIICLLLRVASPENVPAQVPYDSGELKLALKRLEVLGSVLYIAAHPDDENTAFLATMAKQRHFRTGNLSITRGEGGQNLLGAEQGGTLGLIRTQELLGARRIDGAEQFFTRAIDFGYSKTTEETLRFWGKEETLADVVWVIRKFRPDVIVSRFTPTRGGHGNHTASAVLAYEAFRAAADPKKFPEQLKLVQPWQATRIVWNGFRFPQGAIDTSTVRGVTEDLGEYLPLLGLSIGELAGKSRSMHKSQGFGASELRGSSVQTFMHVDGDTANTDLFDGINTSWTRVPGGKAVQELLGKAIAQFNPEKPVSILPFLLKAKRELRKLKSDQWVEVKAAELDNVLFACSGLWTGAYAATFQTTPGSSVPVTVVMLNRSSFPCEIKSVGLTFGERDTVPAQILRENIPFEVRMSMKVPAGAPFSQPYWLEKPAGRARYTVNDQQLVGKAENPPSTVARITFLIGGEPLCAEVPVRYRWVDPTGGELYRNFNIVSPVSLAMSNEVIVTRTSQSGECGVVVRNTVPAVKGEVMLRLPPGWKSEPEKVQFTFDSTLSERNFRFTLKPSTGAGGGKVVAEARIAGAMYDRAIVTAVYPHIPPQSFSKRSQADLVVLDVRTKGASAGYIVGAGDEVPAALTQLGYSVELLSDEQLETGDLSRFNVIIAGIRAYNTREKLRSANGRLLEYVRQGGRYIVQYNTRQQSENSQIGPFPFTITQDRVSVEDAPVRFSRPDHPVLTQPNKITTSDFEGWVQERGLYFAGAWAAAYETPLECHDPGEDPKVGGLLYARYGKGYYVYTGLSFFRQLPAGVPGAYRLFANLLSQDVDH
jgi:LmbE family N-acetylglucosaminyl deacetylase